MAKTIYCHHCKCEVMHLATGSKTMIGATVYCKDCAWKQERNGQCPSMFDQIFGAGLRGNKPR